MAPCNPKKMAAMASLLATVLFVHTGSGCGPCGEGEEFWQHISGGFPNLEISGQGDLYPTTPQHHFGYGFRPEDPQWNENIGFIDSPATSTTFIYGNMEFSLSEPYCDDGFPDQHLGCGRVSMGHGIAGPKTVGEIYQVMHFRTFPEPAEPPAVYLQWTEEKYYEGLGDFPEYHSVSVTGTAEVTDLEPFQMVYDVHFLDENGTPRDVKVGFLLGYTEGCRIVD